ncbi:hypothetical protein A3D88_01495 [Candidatus Peribacteria bacterium RIFCSPHIGHO2_02_FULL_52_16]|nr:MAG: hypothetical protein A2706_03735 [Candidatus Peribacteria bacterium RIFCSPHIGHO2_01_FULL_51_35]OGJ60994.1 MAG: hypothetical protein A3D88_01495 [Candidatus Peribacteria bacterium RIFCSPHIGHO2_02_FULL_52_16]
MRITYVTHTRFPVQKAHGKQIADVCAALAAIGHTVTLLCPTVSNSIKLSWNRYYDLPESFKVKTLGHKDATRQWWVPGVFHFRINMRRYQKALKTFFETHKTDLIYVRSPQLLPVLLRAKADVILELHSLPRLRKKKFAALCNKCVRIVCLTTAMERELLYLGVKPKKVIVEPDAANLERFAKSVSVKVAKKRTKVFPLDRPVIGYFGSFYTQNNIEKGVSVLIEAILRLRRKKVRVYAGIGGGWGKEINEFQKKVRAKNLEEDVRLLGHLPPAQIPEYMLACDVLVYPAPASKHPYFQRDTSPLKLFEYLAAGRPIVCADLPPLRDIVSKETVYFATPGDPNSFAHWIEYVLEHPDEAAVKVKKGLAAVAYYSWEKRMRRILKGL